MKKSRRSKRRHARNCGCQMGRRMGRNASRGRASNPLVRGDQLTADQKRQVLNAFIYRWTKENEVRARQLFAKHGGPPRIAPVTDAQWIKDHAFHMTKAGHLQLNRRHAEPAFMAKNPGSWKVYKSGKYIGIIESNYPWASAYWKKKSTPGVKYELRATSWGVPVSKNPYRVWKGPRGKTMALANITRSKAKALRDAKGLGKMGAQVLVDTKGGKRVYYSKGKSR